MSDTVTLDPRNANRGTERGEYMVEHSLRTYGAARGPVSDKHGVIIAGNKTVAKAIELGIPIELIESDGKTLYVIKRTDLDLSTDPAAMELGVMDNRSSEVGLSFDPDVLKALQEDGADLSALWYDYELAQVTGNTETDDPNAHWTGMPEFAQEDQTAQFQAIINFSSMEAVAAFEQLISQDIPRNTRSVWYPAVERQRAREFGYQSNES